MQSLYAFLLFFFWWQKLTSPGTLQYKEKWIYLGCCSWVYMIFMILWVVSVIYFRFSYLIHWWKSIFVFLLILVLIFFLGGGRLYVSLHYCCPIVVTCPFHYFWSSQCLSCNSITDAKWSWREKTIWNMRF